jgi:4-amino-4-deoxy-L-arabinose transferase-like glycosyltransferase
MVSHNENESRGEASGGPYLSDDVANEREQDDRSTPTSPRVGWLAGLITVGTLIRIPQLWHGLNEMHAFRQTQTAYVALEYARYGINPFHTPLPVFGPNADVPMEFPLVQAVAAVLIRLGARSDSAVRIIGLAGFQAAAILLAVLAVRWHGKLTAIVVIALFEFSPFALAWGASALIDFPAVALSLGMVVGLDAWFHRGSRVALSLGALSAWLAFLVKATTPPAWCALLVVSALIAYLTTRSWGRLVAGFLVGPMAGVLVGIAWVRYADAVKERNPLTRFLVSGNMHDWNFGSVDQRLDPHAYVPVLVRVGSEIAGPLALGLAVVVVGIVLAPTTVERLRRAGWLVTAAFSPLVFFNLYYVHNYYLIGVFPAIVAAVGIGIVAIAQRLRANTTVVAAVATAVVVFGSAVPQDIAQWLTPPKPDPNGQRIRAATQSGDLIVVVGCRWDPKILYFADRRGAMVFDANLAGWQSQGIKNYRYLFNCDPAQSVTGYIPAGYKAIPTQSPDLWRLLEAPGQ